MRTDNEIWHSARFHWPSEAEADNPANQREFNQALANYVADMRRRGWVPDDGKLRIGTTLRPRSGR